MNRTVFTLLFVVFLAALFSTACVYESEHLKDLQCSADGQRQGDAVCTGGFWIFDPLDDVAASDVGDLTDAGADVIEPPLDADELPQDAGHDVLEDVAEEEDSGNHDVGQPDVDEPEADSGGGEPDVEEGDVGDVDDPDAGNTENGDHCTEHKDCLSGYCSPESTCEIDICKNGIKDAGEVDIDCGGTCAQQCGGYLNIASGGWHTCAIRADHSVACWGHPNQVNHTPPTTEKYKLLTGGDRFVCGILDQEITTFAPGQSNVRCWGQLDGSNSYGIFDPPADILFDTINAGQEHICGIDINQKLHCWGRNEHNRINPSNSDAPNAPVGQRVNDYTWLQVHSGARHSCAVAEGDVFRCWGSHADDRRKIDDRTGKSPFTRMVAGNKHTCATTASENIRCYSKNSGDDIRKNIPQNVVVQQIDSRTEYACIIKQTDASLACWGHNHKGRVNGAPQTGRYMQISTGWEHACALHETTGQITCWGNTDNARYPAAFAVQ